MTYKEILEEWIKQKPQGRQNGKTFWHMVKIALEKAYKYRWHDLRKNPDDLPTHNCFVLAWILPPNRKYLFRTLKLVYYNDLMGICDTRHFHNGNVGKVDYENYDSRIIAWKYIEPFEGVDE